MMNKQQQNQEHHISEAYEADQQPTTDESQVEQEQNEQQYDVGEENYEFPPPDYPSFTMPPPPRILQGVAVGALRDQGLLRESNQDSIYAMTTTLPRGTTSDLSMGLFIVADGMGGHEDGDLASRIAIRTIVEHVFANFISPMLHESMAEAMQTLMQSAIQKANQEIWDYAQMIGSDMGATCTAALLLGHSLSIGHVGDTRAYLLKDGQLEQITTDHSAVGRLIQLGQLDASAAREHPLRSQLYRSIGQSPNVEVDILYQDVSGYTHLLLCSDGLWDMVLEDAIATILMQQDCPQQLCQDLISQANTNGGEDNISAIIVTLPIEEEESSPDTNFGA
jgi:serine/threonine protein phosphatase PrpC